MTRLEQLAELLDMAARRSADQRSTDFVFRSAIAVGMIETKNPGGRWMTGYCLEEGDDVLRVLYRYYDQSQAFSIRPDKNIIEIQLTRAGVAVTNRRHDYED